MQYQPSVNDSEVESEVAVIPEVLYILFHSYKKQLEIIEAVVGGHHLMISNDQLNSCYLILDNLVESVLKLDVFKDLAAEKPSLFDRVSGNLDEFDMEWEHMSKDAYSFLAEIERRYIHAGGSHVKLEEFDQVLAVVDRALLEHQGLNQRESDEWVKRVEQIARKFNLQRDVNTLLPSEIKRDLVEELACLHKALNIPRLYERPDHKETKDWLAEVSAVLKQLDESDYRQFTVLRDRIYPNVSPTERESTAHRIDAFIREKVAAFRQYDFSDLDSPKEQRDGNTYVIGPVGQLNQGERQTVSSGDIASHADQKSQTNQSWLRNGIVLALVGGAVTLLVAFLQGRLGIS